MIFFLIFHILPQVRRLIHQPDGLIRIVLCIFCKLQDYDCNLQNNGNTNLISNTSLPGVVPRFLRHSSGRSGSPNLRVNC